jgi:transcriptional regulator with XRE-family HTH domain
MRQQQTDFAGVTKFLAKIVKECKSVTGGDGVARAPVGQRIRKRRQELGRSQLDLARAVGISASYLNLIEHNKRTIGGSLANRVAAEIGLDSRALTGTEEARLIAEVAEAALDSVLIGSELTAEDAREIVATSPSRPAPSSPSIAPRGASPHRHDRRAPRRGFVSRGSQPARACADSDASDPTRGSTRIMAT